ncbi:MAG TPA: nicotinate-nucleotide adenylyltransferase [Ktedonobacteraceae bacterium]|nr:nicotinate-nucleotide adenylyltransferase [Ktedonobacteraceae bacterium]
MEKYSPLPDKRRIGLIGGTFDPIHYAHLAIAEEVRTALDLTEMVFIPAGEPPHKIGHTLTAIDDRLAMLQLAIASNPHFTYSRVEIDRSGPSYLVDTLRILHAEWGTDINLYFVIGWDSLEELHHWHDPLGILEQLTHLVVVKRPGHSVDIEYNKQLELRLPGIMQRLLVTSAPQLAISSTDLRRRVAEERSIKYLLPETVERYIYEHGLYHPVHRR